MWPDRTWVGPDKTWVWPSYFRYDNHMFNISCKCRLQLQQGTTFSDVTDHNYHILKLWSDTCYQVAPWDGNQNTPRPFYRGFDLDGKERTNSHRSGWIWRLKWTTGISEREPSGWKLLVFHVCDQGARAACDRAASRWDSHIHCCPIEKCKFVIARPKDIRLVVIRSVSSSAAGKLCNRKRWIRQEMEADIKPSM